MVDNVSREVRSRVMCSILSRGTQPEVLMRMALVGSKMHGWRMHRSTLPGKPDFIFEKKKLAIFVDGCFWHGCKICYRGPKSSKKYWSAKLRANKKRDTKIDKALILQGWRVLRFWEHQVRESANDCVIIIRKSR